ncbi:MAG: hypothetical protein WA875_02680 [Candidatus Acidiferrales bacterium]
MSALMTSAMRPAMKAAAATAVMLMLAASGTAQAQNRAVTVDAGRTTGTIRSLDGVNGGPAPVMAGLPSLEKQYREARVDIVRTHDYMGPTEMDSQFDLDNATLAWLVPDTEQRRKLVEAGNAAVIFPDWSKDPEKAENYNFGATDKAIEAIRASGAEVYYRIGRSFGARTAPPVDFDKYAEVVKHVEMHYNSGWAHGYHDGIRYWEFWNEPELFWSGTAEQFYSLYEKTARALKSENPSLEVGGPTLAFPTAAGAFREGFLDYCAAHHVPLDFFSWHTYADYTADPLDASRIAERIHALLGAHGFPAARSILSEYNRSADFTEVEKDELRSADNAAFVADTLIYLEDQPVDRAIFYRGDAAWMGLFDMQGKPYKPAFALRAMGEMADTPERVATTGGDQDGFAVLAGRSKDGKRVQILMGNYEIPPNYQAHVMVPPAEFMKGTHVPDFSKIERLPARKVEYRNNGGYDLTVENLPWGEKEFTVKRYRLDGAHDWDLVETKEGRGGEWKNSETLAAPAVEMVVLERK